MGFLVGIICSISVRDTNRKKDGNHGCNRCPQKVKRIGKRAQERNVKQVKQNDMRKIFYLMTFMVCAIWFASCEPAPESQVGMNETIRNHPEQVVSYECQYCHREHYLFYNKFVLGGHHYIAFNDKSGNKGIVHDPDCPYPYSIWIPIQRKMTIMILCISHKVWHGFCTCW